MLRQIHRWPGLVAAVLVLVLALSGAALSVYPSLERLSAPQAESTLSVADLAERVRAAHPGLEQIRRSPSGRVVAWWFEDGKPGAAVIDPATGADLGNPDPLPGLRWLTDLHRSLLLGDTGRIIAALGAGAMLVLTLSGAAMVARRMGGWRRWFGRSRGAWPGRIHVDLARFALGGLLLSALTALWMSASTFSLLPEGAADPAPANATAGLPRRALAQIPLFADTPAHALRELSFPAANDPTDVFTLTTAGGTALVDPGSGVVLSSARPDVWARISEIVVMLHTGRGAAVLGLILGVMALVVPVLGATGLWVWLAARRLGAGIRGNAAAGEADTVLLVASEGGSTWGFAHSLQAALRQAGHRVHSAPLGQFDPARYRQARRFLILAATYGDGAAPASARGALARLQALQGAPAAPFAILGFGDRSFPDYCAFASQLRGAALRAGWAELMAMDMVDRQSAQDFARWGRALGKVLGHPLELVHLPARPETATLRLLSRRDYGAEVQAPTAILRFALPHIGLWQRLAGRGFARFKAGDLLGIIPEGSTVPRYYSLASSAQDGFVEICVRRQPGGLCSGQLTQLQAGATIAAFLRRNPDFRPAKGAAPVLLIGAGTGVGPLAGFIRANRRRPMHLFFGARNPDSDLLYGDELQAWQREGRLTTLSTAYSRHGQPQYVQDRLRAEAPRVAGLIAAGAQVMVCGGREMAAAVREALGAILAGSGKSVAMLKAEGRYAEDIY